MELALRIVHARLILMEMEFPTGATLAPTRTVTPAQLRHRRVIIHRFRRIDVLRLFVVALAAKAGCKFSKIL